MVDAVLAGDGLDAVATFTANATGGAVAIVLPAVGAAVAGAGAERRLDAVRRFVAARLAGQPGALPPGYLADAAVGSDGELLGAVVLLDDGRPPAAGADAALRLAAVASLALAALRDAAGDGARAAGALLEDVRRAPHEADALVARAAALREADLALALVRAGEAAPADAAAGAWQLLVRLAVSDPAVLRRLRDTSVGPALVHDADHGSDLVGTFRTYLSHGANMNAAAAAIPSHRHTVAYRLERLRELTGLHPARADDRERLGLGVKAQLVLEALAEVR
jgi:hypothetical protein